MKNARDIKYFVAANGKEPYTEWINGIRDVKTRSKIAIKVDRLRLGNFGDCEAIGEGLSELKIHYGPGYRVYFGQSGNTIIILLCGGDKSTQRKDIKQAHEYWNILMRGQS